MFLKTVALLGASLSLAASLCAQRNNPVRTADDQFFDLPHYSIEKAFHIDLSKGNYLEVELVDGSQLSRFQNIDSLLLVFLSDMKPFKDSLSDPLSGKRVDYRVDTAGHKMVRIRETRSPGTTFLLGENDPSLLRLRQDTVYIMLAERKNRFNRLTVILNRYSDLENWIATGLNTKMQEMGIKKNNTWAGDWNPRPGKPAYLRQDPSITLKDDSIYSDSHTHDYLELDAIVGLQNYKNYLTPSVDLGVTIGLRRKDYVNQFGLYWEPLFLFGADSRGRLRTYRNDLLVFHYAFDVAGTLKDPLAPVGLNTNISLGYFIRRSGDYFERDSWRLTAGEIKFRGNRIVLQPCIYFSNIFKNVTPGLRLCYKAF
ncbi:hypothetical protein [Puia sp.]|jgi:hypothetical protein|uniref:hypothetical protein n=1 Tax=Puia sp. TaxID=2045100 RepID=UPI002F3E81EB